MSLSDSTPAVRLDHALDRVLGGEPQLALAAVAADPDLRPLVDLAVGLQDALPAPPVAARFEARLGARLAQANLLERGARALRHPNRLLVTGAALSSAALGVGVTAYAVWRSSRRPAGVGPRPWQR